MSTCFPPVELVIFDFDGVIVDSEIIFNEILSEEITRLGWILSPSDCLREFTGKSTSAVDQLIKNKIASAPPPHFRDLINQRVAEELPKRLKSIEFVEEVLAKIQRKCIASNSALAKILLSLQITELSQYFKITEIFNSEMVIKGKPDPELFLLAAEKMGVPPEKCLVVEDSLPGIQAAHAANMRAIGFVGGTHAKEAWYLKSIELMKPIFITSNLREIINFI
jgi:HAD superfamily hydrolase (TIGR01509 family)